MTGRCFEGRQFQIGVVLMCVLFTHFVNHALNLCLYINWILDVYIYIYCYYYVVCVLHPLM